MSTLLSVTNATQLKTITKTPSEKQQRDQWTSPYILSPMLKTENKMPDKMAKLWPKTGLSWWLGSTEWSNIVGSMDKTLHPSEPAQWYLIFDILLTIKIYVSLSNSTEWMRLIKKPTILLTWMKECFLFHCDWLNNSWQTIYPMNQSYRYRSN